MDKNDSFAYDLDLFLTDSTWGKIHLATAGGHVRDKIYNDPEHLETKINLQKSTNFNYEYKLNPNLDEILKLGDREMNFRKFDKDMYLRDFIFYAKKGYLSFDKTYVNKPLDFHYHLVAYPINDTNIQFYELFTKPIEMNILK